LNSAIYEGSIRHRRFHPVENAFQYRIFFLYLDLAEVPEVFDIHPLWSVERLNVASFLRRDHMGDRRVPLDRTVRDGVEAACGRRPAGPVRLLTHLRYLGYCFNPVSFYYCYDRGETTVEAVVADVHNTPWGESHPYVLCTADSEHPSPRWRRFRFSKAFHVSPFMDMTYRYDWRFRMPGENLGVHMDVGVDGRRLFDATLRLRRRDLTAAALTRALLRYPLMTWKVTAMIYWQALRLLLKGAPLYTHPRKRAARKEGPS
jgi:DUF1365 family protein